MAKQAGQFTDMKRVKELIALMTQNDLTELELVEDKSKIALRRGAPGIAHAHAVPVGPTAHPVPAPLAAPSVDEKLVPLKSPLVGTFYAAANPQSDPFASVGTVVAEDSVVCIIEAMKVFNEIRAEISGTITKILVQNGQSVEFGQPLFLVKPN